MIIFSPIHVEHFGITLLQFLQKEITKIRHGCWK